MERNAESVCPEPCDSVNVMGGLECQGTKGHKGVHYRETLDFIVAWGFDHRTASEACE